MPEAGTTFASFAATHEDRLVRSVMSEIGLSHAEAAAVAREVLPAAFQRTFATCGAAYGWLRVAARHRAAGSDRWAAAADAALGHADSALVVLAGLSHEDRELLRLRYVDGLLPAALAERTGRTLAEVQDGLDRASAAARAVTCEPEADLAQRIPAPRMPARGSLPRFAAAAALAALALLSAGVTPSSPPLAGEPFRPAFDPMTPVTTTAADAPEAVTARPAYRTVAGPAATSLGSPVRTVPIDDPDTGQITPCRGCPGSGSNFADELHVGVPKEVGDATGQREVVVKDVAGEVVHFCDAFAPVPGAVARCERRPS